MLGSGANGKKPIKEVEKLRARKPKLERVVSNSTERKQAEEALRKSEQELKIRNRVNHIFLTIPDEKMYAGVLNLVLEVMESKFGTFGYFKENGAFVVPAMTREIFWDKCNVPEKDIIFERGTFSGIWGMAIKEKRTLFSNQGPFNTPKGHIPVKNTMVTPIIFHDEVISAIHIANKANDYDETDQVMLETLTRHIAPVLYARLQADKQDKERKKAEEKSRRRGDLLNGINRILKEALTCESDSDVARTFLEVAEELTHSKFGFICEVNETGRFDTLAISDPGWDACIIPKTKAVRMLNDLEVRGIRGRVIKEEQPLIFNDPSSHPEWVEPPKGHPEITCFLGVPLKYSGKTIGMIGLANKESGYDLADQQAIETLSVSFVEALMRKRAEEALRKREGLHELFFSQSLDGFFYMMFDEPIRWDDTVDKEKVLDYVFAHHQITKINDAMLQQYGASREQYIGLTPNDLYAHDIAYGRDVWRDLFDAGRLHLETDERKLDGTPIWIDGDYICLYDSQGRITGHFGIQREITEEKRAREALRKSRDYLQKLTNSMWDAVFSVKMPERVIEWANDSFRLIGYESQECIGKTTEFLYPDDSESLDFGNKLKGAMAAGKDVLHAEQILKRKNGDTFPAEITTTFFREKGEIVRVTSIVRDVSERKKAEEQIAKLAKFPAENPNPVLRISGRGTVVYTNTAGSPLLKSWRCRVGESLPEPWHEFVLDALSSGQNQQTEVKCDGRIFSLTFAPVLDANYVNIYGLDITERKKVEDELRESEDKYRDLFESASDIVLAVGSQGEIIDINRRAEELTGFTRQELLEMNVLRDLTVAEDRDRIRQVIANLIKGLRQVYEVRWRTKDGTILLFEGSSSARMTKEGKFLCTRCILRDITERKKAEKALKESEVLLREAQRVSHVGSWVLNVVTGKLSWSDETYRIYGFKPQEFVPTYEKFSSIVHPDDNKFVQEEINSALQNKKDYNIDFRFVRPNGEIGWIHCEGEVIRDKKGKPIRFFGTQIDLTERKKAEERLLEHQSKLKAMASEMLMTEERERQRLAVGLHDEVCQKLVLTKLALESSLNLVSDSKVLASLRIACGAIGETIEQADSLTFKLSNPVLRQLGFVIALEKYLTEEIRQKHGIEYELEGDEQLGTLQDEIKNCLFRVTRELLTNVVKHAQACKVKVSARESQSQIYVRVQDDGVGFKESQAGSKVSQTARFGLFSIREQLEYLGGHLEIDSVPGRGTKATVVVPLTKKAIV